MQLKLVITDLDGTLLDENYDWRRAEKELRELKKRNIPVIFCSGKTREEQRELREEMGINDPYIVEDGSAIVIPDGFGDLSDVDLNGLDKLDSVELRREKGETLIVLGESYDEIVRYLDEVERDTGCLRYYARMSDKEVSRVTGLSLERAGLARKREFSETLVEWCEEALKKIRERFNVEIGGRFAHVYGKGADKGRAVKLLRRLYEKLGYDVWILGIGNHYTDVPMLKAVDQPAIVKNPDGWIDVDIPGLYRAEGISTDGWREVIRKFIL